MLKSLCTVGQCYAPLDRSDRGSLYDHLIHVSLTAGVFHRNVTFELYRCFLSNLTSPT